MDFVNLNDKRDEAIKTKTTKINLFGTENFRSWILCFQPGDGTDMHFHASPETFMVVEGKALIKGVKGEERVVEKNGVAFFGANEYYQVTNVGTGPLLLFANRSEAFGGVHVTLKD